MRVRSLLPLPVLAAVLVAAPAAAQDAPPPAQPQPGQSPRIAPGVTAGGIDVGGLTVIQAAQKLKAEAPAQLQAPLTYDVAGRKFRLAAADAKLVVNATKTAERALAAPAPAQDAAGGVAAKSDVALVLSHSEAAVAAFVGSVTRKVTRAPRNATLRITLRKMVTRRAKAGFTIDQLKARKVIDTALEGTTERIVHTRVKELRAVTNIDDLRAQNNTVLTVEKATFTLRLFKGLKFRKSYGVATGQPAYPTPSGLFSIANKQVDPVWSVPNSPWAGELQGTTVAGGSAANPLKARWMGIANGIGIHGTGEEYSIGSRASHGCLRMRVASVKDLYSRVPVGTPILIK